VTDSGQEEDPDTSFPSIIAYLALCLSPVFRLARQPSRASAIPSLVAFPYISMEQGTKKLSVSLFAIKGKAGI
jgi:hypothetical protein